MNYKSMQPETDSKKTIIIIGAVALVVFALVLIFKKPVVATNVTVTPPTPAVTSPVVVEPVTPVPVMTVDPATGVVTKTETTTVKTEKTESN